MQSYPAKRALFWKVAQILGIAGTALLLIGFVQMPDFTLRIFWGILVPLLPATFLITPILWRSLCPIASFNMLGNGLLGRRALPSRSIPAMSLAGIFVFGLMVPARHFVFNNHGVLLAVTVVIILLAALALGACFDAKAGFCNTICPVLPVEKLYGQHPLIEMRNPRCSSCQLCTPKGCIDLSPQKSIIKTMGPAHRSHRWITTPLGIFATALPGFVFGYFMVSDTSWAEAGGVYLHILIYTVGSFALIAGLSAVFRWTAKQVLPITGALAIALYYTFVSPQVAEGLGFAPSAAWVIRVAAFALIALWLFRALGSSAR